MLILKYVRVHLLIHYQRAVDQGLTMNEKASIYCNHFQGTSTRQHSSFFPQLEQLTGKVKTQENWRCGIKKPHKAQHTTTLHNMNMNHSPNLDAWCRLRMLCTTHVACTPGEAHLRMAYQRQIGGMCYQACNSTGSSPWLGASACAFGPDLLIEFPRVGPFPASLPTVCAYT